jgi:non-specific serine/threonine protein kinase
VALSQGDHGLANELLEESLTMVRRSGTDTDVVRVLTALGTLAISRGEDARAVGCFEEALSLARKTEDARGVAVALNNLGHATLHGGDPQRARTLFEEALAKDREVGEAQGAAVSLINLALAALTLGDHGQATGLLLESLTLLRKVENKEIVIECLEAMAGAAGAGGQAQRAARLWGAAQALREEMGAPLPSDELAMLEPHLAAARSLLGTEAWEAARTEGRAMASEQAVEYALLGERPEPPAIPTPERAPGGKRSGVLTRREEEVAALVARGLSNRRIAEKLFVSERTVEHHVSKVMRKLEAGSRAQVAAWATRQELFTPDTG